MCGIGGFWRALGNLKTHSINRRDHRIGRVLARTLATNSVVYTVDHVLNGCGPFFLPSMISHRFDKTINSNTLLYP